MKLLELYNIDEAEEKEISSLSPEDQEELLTFIQMAKTEDGNPAANDPNEWYVTNENGVETAKHRSINNLLIVKSEDSGNWEWIDDAEIGSEEPSWNRALGK